MFENEESTRIEKIINPVGLQYESDIKVMEFNDMIESETQEESDPDGELNPVELNSLEFFIKALSYFEGDNNPSKRTTQFIRTESSIPGQK